MTVPIETRLVQTKTGADKDRRRLASGSVFKDFDAGISIKFVYLINITTKTSLL
jgi:hypothetical protein